MRRLSRNAKILCFSLLVIMGLGSYYFFNLGEKQGSSVEGSYFWPKNMPKQVAGVETKRDLNHPVEIYFGSRELITLDAMISDLKVKVYPEDKVVTFPPPEMGLGSRITISRATPVEVTDAKIVKTYRTWAESIKDLLVEQKIELLNQDSVEPNDSTAISADMKIKITRVAELDLIVKEDIDFKTTKKTTMDMERGQNKVETKGVKGQKEVTYHIKRIDGEEVSKKVTDTKILSEPTTEVLIVGIGPKLVHSGPFVDLLNQAAKKYNVNATALQCLMIRESNGHTDSVASAGYVGLFQYDPGFWGPASAAAGFGGAAWTDAKAQIFTTARLISIGQSRRWPPYAHCKDK
jgi:hypothetical protein